MRCDFAFELVGFLDQRFQFFKAVLSSSDCVALREHAAGGASLDDVRAILDLQTNGQANLFRAVGDAVDRRKLSDAGPKAILITVAAADADCVACCFHAWSRDP